MNFLRKLFSFACFSAALGMTIFWVYKYSKDEDLCVVDYKNLGSSKDVENPILSFCFIYPVIEWKLKSYNTSFTIRDYNDYLRGLKDVEGMEYVDFDNVTVNLPEYYLADITGFKNT